MSGSALTPGPSSSLFESFLVASSKNNKKTICSSADVQAVNSYYSSEKTIETVRQCALLCQISYSDPNPLCQLIIISESCLGIHTTQSKLEYAEILTGGITSIFSQFHLHILNIPIYDSFMRVYYIMSYSKMQAAQKILLSLQVYIYISPHLSQCKTNFSCIIFKELQMAKNVHMKITTLQNIQFSTQQSIPASSDYPPKNTNNKRKAKCFAGSIRGSSLLSLLIQTRLVSLQYIYKFKI